VTVSGQVVIHDQIVKMSGRWLAMRAAGQAANFNKVAAMSANRKI